MSLLTGRFSGNILILALLGLLALAGPLLGHPHKFDRGKRVNFDAMIPTNPGQWEQRSIKSSENLPEALDINELYQALYYHPDFGEVALTLEYTSDSRREFELHYPDICHSIRGDQVVKFPHEQIVLSDRSEINAEMMSWQQRNGGYSALTAYWYVTPDGITTDSMELKIKQALSGLFSKPEEAVMVRFDAFFDETPDSNKRATLLAAIKSLNQDIESQIDTKTNTLLYKHLNEEEI